MNKNRIRKCTWLKEISILLMVKIFKSFLDSLILNSRKFQWLTTIANLRLVSPCYQHFWFVVLSNLFHFNIDVYIHKSIIVCSWRSEQTQGIGLCLLLWLRQGLLLFAAIYARLAGLQASGDFPISLFHLVAGVLELETYVRLYTGSGDLF